MTMKGHYKTRISQDSKTLRVKLEGSLLRKVGISTELHLVGSKVSSLIRGESSELSRLFDSSHIFCFITNT